MKVNNPIRTRFPYKVNSIQDIKKLLPLFKSLNYNIDYHFNITELEKMDYWGYFKYPLYIHTNDDKNILYNYI